MKIKHPRCLSWTILIAFLMMTVAGILNIVLRASESNEPVESIVCNGTGQGFVEESGECETCTYKQMNLIDNRCTCPKGSKPNDTGICQCSQKSEVMIYENDQWVCNKTIPGPPETPCPSGQGKIASGQCVVCSELLMNLVDGKCACPQGSSWAKNAICVCEPPKKILKGGDGRFVCDSAIKICELGEVQSERNCECNSVDGRGIFDGRCVMCRSDGTVLNDGKCSCMDEKIIEISNNEVKCLNNTIPELIICPESFIYSKNNMACVCPQGLAYFEHDQLCKECDKEGQFLNTNSTIKGLKYGIAVSGPECACLENYNRSQDGSCVASNPKPRKNVIIYSVVVVLILSACIVIVVLILVRRRRKIYLLEASKSTFSADIVQQDLNFVGLNDA